MVLFLWKKLTNVWCFGFYNKQVLLGIKQLYFKAVVKFPFSQMNDLVSSTSNIEGNWRIFKQLMKRLNAMKCISKHDKMMNIALGGYPPPSTECCVDKVITFYYLHPGMVYCNNCSINQINYTLVSHSIVITTLFTKNRTH